MTHKNDNNYAKKKKKMEIDMKIKENQKENILEEKQTINVEDRMDRI